VPEPPVLTNIAPEPSAERLKQYTRKMIAATGGKVERPKTAPIKPRTYEMYGDKVVQGRVGIPL
jgi:hypothetical protein